MVEIPEDEVLYGGALMEAAAARIRELEAENARLRAELDTVKHQGGYTRSLLDDAEFQVARLRDEQNKLQWQVDFGAVVVERLNADLAAARKDGERFDWLEDIHGVTVAGCIANVTGQGDDWYWRVDLGGDRPGIHGNTIRAAIDAAKAEGEGE